MKYIKGNGSLEPLTILDSKHIVTTKLYNIKLVECGDYTQIYLYENKKMIKSKKKLHNDLELEKLDLKLNDTSNSKVKSLCNKIEMRSIMRSKLECQRLAKSNINDWQTFITLTFKENITDIEVANKQFRNYIDKIKRVKKDFKYLCIPEFQKRGAVHYHLLTNLECNSNFVPKRDFKNLYNPSSKRWKKINYYDLKYWKNGYSSAEPIAGNPKKIIGYISKYMTKDIDNRLFNRHRYFYSRNLVTPQESYIDTDDTKNLNIYSKIIQEANLVYHNSYRNPYDNTKVIFLEYLN